MLNTSLTASLQYYMANLPWMGSHVSIDAFEPLKLGIDSEVYRFTVSYDEGGERQSHTFALKVYQDTTDGKDRALKERHALHHLRVVHYAVPGVLVVEIDPEHLGRPFIIMEYVESQTMLEHIAAAQGDSETLDALALLFAELFAALHQHDYKLLVPRMAEPSTYALINREIHTMRGLIRDYGQAELTPLLDWLYAQRATVTAPQISVTHRDFHPSNVLITADGLPYVVDWGWQISDARFDVAWTLAQLEREGHGAFAAQVLREYERLRGDDVPHLAYFTLLAETRWLISVLARARYGFETAEGREAYIESMRAPIRDAVQRIEQATGLTLSLADASFK